MSAEDRYYCSPTLGMFDCKQDSFRFFNECPLGLYDELLSEFMANQFFNGKSVRMSPCYLLLVMS